MPISVFGSFLLYCAVNAFTPGPGNILALSTVSNYGWKRGRPLFLGIFAGYYAVQLICALFVYGVSAVLPNVLGALKYLGAAYILWLAIHIVRSKPEAAREGAPASFWKGFMLQFVNVKIYMFGITALTGYVTDFSAALPVLVGFELLIATIGTAATTTWIAAGVLLQRFYLKHYRVVNAVLALALAECVYAMLR